MPRTGEITVKIEDHEICIRFPVGELCAAVVDGRIAEGAQIQSVKDETLFAFDVVKELENEDEEGSTRIHQMFDSAVEELANNGCPHITCDGDDD